VVSYAIKLNKCNIHFIAPVRTCARNNPATKAHGHVAYANLRLSRGVLLTYLNTYLPTYLLNLSQHYDGDVDLMCNLSFAYFLACSNSHTKACKTDAGFILFYFIAGLVSCAINVLFYFIATFILSFAHETTP